MTQFDINDRIEKFVQWWWDIPAVELTRSKMTEELRKHIGHLRPGLTPEEVEAVVKEMCKTIGAGYDGPGHPSCDVGMEGHFRRILTRYAVAGGEGEACLGSFASQGIGALKARAEAAEKELAEAKARIEELERRVKSLDETEVSERTLWDQLCKSERTIVAQAHEIRELKEARR